MNKVSIINGPNLNLLGKREPEIYGSRSLEAIMLEATTAFPKLVISATQHNSEGAIIDAIHANADAAFGIINAGGYTHTSVAIRDAIAAVPTQYIEVHLSNVYAREFFRHKSYLSAVCKGVMCGFGPEVYKLALGFIQSQIDA